MPTCGHKLPILLRGHPSRCDPRRLGPQSLRPCSPDCRTSRLLRQLRRSRPFSQLPWTGNLLLADTHAAQIGVQQPADIATLQLAEFQRFLDVNTTGTFLVTREATRMMRVQKLRPVLDSAPGRGTTRGSIVNLCSASSLSAAWGVLPYTTSKHASLGLTKNSGEFLRAGGTRAVST